MALYCGIDLHATNHLVVVIDERDRRVLEKRLANDVSLTLNNQPYVIPMALGRSGPPSDAASDLSAPVWAGVIPLELKAGKPLDEAERAGATLDMTRLVDEYYAEVEELGGSR